MNNPLLNLREENDIGLVELNQGITNAINADLIFALSGTLRELSEDPKIRGLVITSANDRFFSIGLDIPQLYDLTPDEFRDFYRSFNGLCLNLLAIPKPVVAAITGHAIAGGYILALCCDYRYIAEGRKLVGVNEVKLGVPVPYVADCILRSLIGYRNARGVMDMGEFFEPEAALKHGMVDRIIGSETLVSSAVEKARQLSSHSLKAYSLIKVNRVEPIINEVEERLEDRETNFIECWYSKTTRLHLKEAMSKF